MLLYSAIGRSLVNYNAQRLEYRSCATMLSDWSIASNADAWRSYNIFSASHMLVHASGRCPRSPRVRDAPSVAESAERRAQATSDHLWSSCPPIAKHQLVPHGLPLLSCSCTHCLPNSIAFSSPPALKNEIALYWPGPFKPVRHCTCRRLETTS